MPMDILPADGLFLDARGQIANLPPFTTIGVTVITSERGAVRGNHYHLHESHLMYVVSGLMVYIEEDADGRTHVCEVGPGGAVVSPPRAPHCTVFPERTVFVTLSDWDRRGQNYEDEVVRIDPMERRTEVAASIAGLPELISRATSEQGGR